MTAENLQTEVETLDREAREALDKMADKREQLRRELAATELAEQREREREQERRRQVEEEAERERIEGAKARYQELREEDDMLSQERDELAARIKEILGEQAQLSVEMQQALREYDQEASNQLAIDASGFAWSWLKNTFKGVQ